jgi:ArsR family transcriptional regulator, arsenate/arsenite/antimonite-responsive transcriptional repressor
MSNILIKIDPAKTARYASLFKALSNPYRLDIFVRLASCCRPGTRWSGSAERACVGEVAKDFDLAPSTVSHHLKELVQAGLICTERAGQNVECWVDPNIVDELADFFKRTTRC